MTRPLIIFLSFLLAAPFYAEACAVCFGKSDNSNLGRAFNWGILILLGFTFSILAGLVIAMIRIERRRSS